MSISRKEEEMLFHDQRERDRQTMSPEEFNRKYSNKSNYVIVRKSVDYVESWLKENVQGKSVLDYCCGLGGNSVKLARLGAAKVTSVDISPESVESTKNSMRENGFSEISEALVMDAENLEFPPASFDIVICSGCLHHLDLDQAYRELHKVIKPDGVILCIEALGHNPFINLYRKLTPHLRTAWEADHILRLQDLNKAKNYFRQVEVTYWHLATIPAILFRKTPFFPLMLKTGEGLDDILLKVPLIKNMAWQIIFFLKSPVSNEGKAH